MRWNRTIPLVLSALAVACSEDRISAPTETSLSEASAAAAGWTSEGSWPNARWRAKAATVNGIVYVIGGGSRMVQAYNAGTRTWATKTALPEPLTPNGATNISGKIYVAGGFYGSRLSRALYVYDPVKNVWTRKADLPSAIERLAGHQGGIGGKLYVYAGVSRNPDGTAGPHRFFRYDPATNAWATLRPPSYARNGGASGVIDGRLYLIGGRLPASRDGYGTAYDVHVYDPASGWIKKPLGNYGLNSGLAYATLGKRLYVVGVSYDSDGCYYNSSTVYDPASHTAQRIDPIAPMRSGGVGAAAGGRFLVMGGAEWEPDPSSTGDWSCDYDTPFTAEVVAYTP